MSLGIPGITAHRAVHVAGPVAERAVLVQGGAGAVGLCAVALARHAKAQVIATVRSESDVLAAKKAGARNDWGMWSEASVLSFRVSPPFWETWWFIALAVVAVGGTIAPLVLNRVRHLLALERLRTKIAADLHDDIGAGLTEIAITSEVIAHKLPDESRATVSGELARIGLASRHLVDSMGDIVWLVNPRRDSLHDLVARLGDIYKEAIAASGISFRVQNLESLKNVRLQMEHRQHIFLIFKEGINNALKYSECSEMTLAVTRERGQTTIRLADDGKGFDPAAVTSGNGLENLEIRAAAIRGRIEVESSPGSGTSVTLAF